MQTLNVSLFVGIRYWNFCFYFKRRREKLYVYGCDSDLYFLEMVVACGIFAFFEANFHVRNVYSTLTILRAFCVRTCYLLQTRACTFVEIKWLFSWHKCPYGDCPQDNIF